MISVPLTALITGLLAMMGITPTPVIIGGIWVAIKVAIALGALGLVSRFLPKKPASSGTRSPEDP